MIKTSESKINKNIIYELKNQYGVRFRKKQKQKFLEYAQTTFNDMGYTTEVQEKVTINKNILSNQNLIIGDIEKANVILCAHYDTPFRSLYRYKIIHGRKMRKRDIIKGGFIILAYLIFITILLGLFNCPTIIYCITIILFVLGIPNKQNLNDNTSGVLTIFKIAAELKELNSSKVAFVLFDNEEWGLIGSKIFKKQNKNIENKLFINFDCVGVGDNIIVIGDDDSIHEAKNIVEKKEKIEGKNILVEKMDLSKAKSDEKTFKRRIRFAAFHRNKKGQLYVDNIHTKKDNDLDINNINSISLIIKDYVSKIY